ncbi:beta,beta-carotene 15,15'-dioxygenase-like [Physella acuta]|uniref:beta,beta-carotene 15,15'-dioxygenase-like n=1 Tax=Physella acuta TaxID=109671 RepID=UPI0027DB157F|nr:beta,beta-carotene 15,15'-dioxygenase-like [Physella acuta]XP_059143586.1 beta,beta-carotene 15,15'-dioxygenase-like [Physella acuta]
MNSAAEIKDLPQYFDFDVTANLDKPIDLPVTGSLPAWVTGSLYRVGNGVYKLGDRAWCHVFDGLALLHRWTIHEGKVTYLSTILDSNNYKKCVKYHRLVGVNFGASFPDPCRTIFNSLFSHFLPRAKSDNTAVHFVEGADKLFALTETTVINEVNPATLKKVAEVDMKDYLAVHMGTAHAHIDTDGSLYYYATHFGLSSGYDFVRIPKSVSGEVQFNKAEILGRVNSRWRMHLSYTHSFGMSENYLVHFEQPLTYNLAKLTSLELRGISVIDAMVEFKDEPINIIVVSKTTGQKVPITYRAPHGFVFHFINCYEDGGFIVCDVCLYKNASVIKELYLEALSAQPHNTVSLPHFARFVLPVDVEKAALNTNLVTLTYTTATAIVMKHSKNSALVDLTSDPVFEESCLIELPRMNYSWNARRYRYFYASTALATHTRKIYKCDVQEKTTREYICDEHHIPGEPVFVSRPDATDEDDGVVLCPILAGTTDHSSYLLVLDAQSFEELARATVPPQLKMNFSFHGRFVNKVF